MMRPLEPGDPQVAGEFRLRARIGAGGMGRVYLGYSPAGRAVAVKICHPEFAADPAFVARFRREVAAARSVNGLYTAPVIAAGPDDSPPWLATGYVPGPSLEHAVTAHGPLAGPAVWRLTAGLAEALQAVHARGLVHRDLKPSNVLLATDGPRVIDFGIARALDGNQLTTGGYAFGTPSYMAPEQADGKAATPASDVFALGSVLCFAATGDAPFGDGEPPAVLYRIVHAEPALEAVSAPLRNLVAHCLAKDPAERPTLPEILRICQARTPQLGGPAASFWPGQVAAMIARYQAGLDDTGLENTRLDGTSLDGAGKALEPPAGEPRGDRTQTSLGNLAVLDRSATPGVAAPPGRDRKTVGPVSRRWAIAGLAAAGLAAAGGGWAYARSGSSGSGRRTASQLLWAGETGGKVSSGPTLADGILYAGSDDGKVHAFEAASGRPVRTYPTSGAVSGGVTVAGGTLFAGSADHGVHAFRVGTGGKAWVYRTGGPVNCTPAVGNGIVYIGSDDGYLYAIHADTGRLAWRYGTGGPVRSGPLLPGTALYSDYVYVGSDDGHLYAIGTDGKIRWRFATSGQVTAGPTFCLGVVCVGDGKGNVFGVSGDGPSLTWKKQAGGAVRGTAAFAGVTLYLGSASSAVQARNIYGGNENWQYLTTGPVNSGLATDANTVYAGDDDGYLYAIDLNSYSPRWRYQAGAAVQSQILVANGVVYFGSLDHRVYALRA